MSAELQVMKCGSMLEGIYKEKDPFKKNFNLNQHLKLVAPNLDNFGDFKGANSSEEFVQFQNEMKLTKQKLMNAGFTDELIKMTRVERYKINDKFVDAYVFPDGVVHHVSNPNSDKSPEELISVKDCKMNERELGCINPSNNERKGNFCFISKPDDAFEFNPACNQEAIDDYISSHNCLMKADPDGCRKLSSLPKGSLGIAAGALGAALMSDKKPEFLKKLQTLGSHLDELRGVPVEVTKEVKFALRNMSTLKKKIIFELLPQYKNNLEIVKKLNKMMDDPTGNYDEKDISEDGNKIRKRFQEYKTTLEDRLKLGFSEIAKKKPGFKFVDSNSLLHELLNDSNMEYSDHDFLVKNNALKKVFPELKTAIRLHEKIIEQARTELIKENSELSSKNLNARVSLLKDKILKSSTPEVKVLYDLYTDRQYLAKESLPSAINTVKTKISKTKINSRLSGGLLGAFTGAGIEASLAMKNQLELNSCKKHFGLKDEEINVLNNESVFLAGTGVRTRNPFNTCESMYIEDPDKTIAEVRKKFGAIPNGICKIITDEKNKLDSILRESFKKVEGSCTENQIKTNDIKIFANENGRLSSEVEINRQEGTFIYQMPFSAENSTPDLKTVTVYKMDSAGARVQDSKLTNEFRNFMNNFSPPGQTLYLNAGLDENSTQTEIKKIRQQNYEALVNQKLRSYYDGCKGYNNLECEVLGKSFNIMPIILVSRSICGNNIFTRNGLMTPKIESADISK